MTFCHIENLRFVTLKDLTLRATQRRLCPALFEVHSRFTTVSPRSALVINVSEWCNIRVSPGGVIIVGPDDTKETFVQNHTVVTPAVGEQKPANVEVVFVENSYDPNPDDDHYEATMVYLIREDGQLRVETDRHILGLFTLDVWHEMLCEVGCRIHAETYVESGKEYITFACLKPT